MTRTSDAGPGLPVAYRAGMTTRTVDLTLDPAWSVGDKPHGGYLLAETAKAALAATHPHPLALSAHYLSAPTTDEPASVIVEQLRAGRSTTSSQLQLRQAGRVCLTAVLTAGRLDAQAEPFWSAHTPVELPAPEECLRLSPQRPDGVLVRPMEQLDVRIDPAVAGFATGEPGRDGAMRGWLRRADGTPTTLLDLLVYADALPPVTMGLGVGGWAPTVELTFLLRGLPAPGWIRAEHHSVLMAGGWMDQDCSLWDSRGQLVAQARQLAAYRLP
jgi:acyl-CoA thioesterase